jgi:hypothetical protein
MAVVLLDLITIGELAIITLDKDPRTDGGYAASIGQLALINNQGSPVGQLYIKTGAGNTAWELTSTTASAGIVEAGLPGRLALYPATGNVLDDVYVQNSQNIVVALPFHPTRSADITYTIPNPGDAVATADFVLTEGTQIINGDKTFGNNVTITGNLDVNGTLTTIDTVNLQISDKLITLNKGGAGSSGGSSGFEIEEGGSATGYFIQNSSRDGWDYKSSSLAHVATFSQAAMTANRTYTLPNVTTTIVGRTGTITANYAAYWNDANQVTAEQFLNVSRGGTGLSGSTAANGTLLIGNGTGYTLTTLTGTANQVIVTNGAGSITLSLPQSIAAGSSPTFTGLTLSSLGAGVVHSSAGGVLSSSAVVLTSEVSGILPIANGGTNSSTALNNGRVMVSVSGAIVEHASITAGSVYFGAASTGLPAQDNANFFWDASNVRLGIKTSSPLDPLHVAGNVRISGSGSTLRLLGDSDFIVSQATVATTDATVTTLATVATTTDTVMLLEVRVSGRRTGGTGGTAGDSATYIRTARILNIAGTVTIANLQSDYTSETVGGWNATITVSGTNALVRVTGAANNNITWQATILRTVV